jgi:hypothetical protein
MQCSSQGRQHGSHQCGRRSCRSATLAGRPQTPRCSPTVRDKRARRAPSPVLWHADGHPTFLVLLDPRRLGVADDALNRLLIQNDLTVGQALGPDELATPVVLGPVGKLALQCADLGTDIPTAAGVRAGPAGDGAVLGHRVPAGRGRGSRGRQVADDGLIDDADRGLRGSGVHDDWGGSRSGSRGGSRNWGGGIYRSRGRRCGDGDRGRHGHGHRGGSRGRRG